MRHLYKSTLLLLTSLVFLQSCDGGGSYVVLKLEAGSLPEGLEVRSVNVDLQLGGKSDHTQFATEGEIKFPVSATLNIVSGQGKLVVQVRAMNKEAKEVAYGSNFTDVFAGTTPLRITLAPSPQLEISPTAQEMGRVRIGDRSAEFTFQIRNAGEIQAGRLAVNLTDEFGPIADYCSIEAALAPGKSCMVKVEFKPTTAGDKSGKLMVSGNMGGSAEATLSGTGFSG